MDAAAVPSLNMLMVLDQAGSLRHTRNFSIITFVGEAILQIMYFFNLFCQSVCRLVRSQKSIAIELQMK